MITRFKKFILENKLFQPTDRILLSVSGGIDSMVMTHLFQRSGYNFAIAHCNFNLRGAESNADEKFVREFAESMSITFFCKKFQTRKYARENKVSIQMAARELRINWCRDLMKEHEFSHYATAHHLDDQTETFFINLLRGTGISGLHGILPKVGSLIHPLMFAWKKEIIRYARVNRVPYRLDGSNLKSEYRRNAIRNKLLPVIREIKPDFDRIMSQNIEHIREAEAIYRHAIDDVSEQLIKWEGTRCRLSIKDLKRYKNFETYLFEILTRYNFVRSVVDDICRSLSAESGKQFYSTTHRLLIDRDFLYIEKRDQLDNNSGQFEIKENVKTISSPIKLDFKTLQKKPDTQLPNDSSMAMLDLDKLTFPLILCKWQKGDYFYPLGMEHKKLLSDFFIDNKLSLFSKEETWLLLSENEIVWVIGQRIDNRFKITAETKNILKVTFQQEK